MPEINKLISSSFIERILYAFFLVIFNVECSLSLITTSFTTVNINESFFAENNWIHLKMKDVTSIENFEGDYILNTGSPHYIKSVSEIATINVFKEGREIRYSKEFEKEGINVNFVEQTDEDNIYVRTYERGVENETLSCGTGVTASALAYFHNEVGFNRIEVATNGGNLAVEFDKDGEQSFKNIWLCGPATFVFKGEWKS